VEDSEKSGKHVRLHITLPEETVQLIQKVAEKSRSAFINDAVLFYGRVLQKVALKKRLQRGYTNT